MFKPVFVTVFLILNTTVFTKRHKVIQNNVLSMSDLKTPLVVDELGEWGNAVALSEVSLLLLYMPWSADCFHARTVYDDIAKLYFKKVYFAAVNCWVHHHHCQFNSPEANKWPKLIAYVRGKTYIQFNGSWNILSLSKFVDGLLMPYIRVYDKNALDKISSYIVVGYFEREDCFEYLIYIKTALKWLEIDPEHNVRFGVSIGLLEANFANSFFVKMPRIELINGNKSQGLQMNQQSNMEEIIHFLKVTIGQSPLFFKACDRIQMLPTLLTKNSVFLMLSSDNALKDQHTLMRDVTKFYEIYQYNITESDHETSKDESKIYMFINSTHDNTHSQWGSSDINILDSIKFVQAHCVKQCHKLFYLNNMVHTRKKTADTLIMSLYHCENSCICNRTLSFLLFNDRMFADFLLRFSADSYYNITNSSAVIIDIENEIVNVIQQNLSLNNMISFIKNYHEGYSVPHDIFDDSSKRCLTTGTSSIDKVNFHTFSRKSSNNMTWVAVIYSPNCALCSLMLHIVLQVSVKYSIQSVKFVRMDLISEEIPWIFNMDSSPTLVILPRNRQMESKVFPDNMSINFRNVYLFVLSNLEPNEQRFVISNICNNSSQFKKYAVCRKTYLLKK